MKFIGKVISYLLLIVFGFMLGLTFDSWKSVLPESVQEMDVIESVNDISLSSPQNSEQVEQPSAPKQEKTGQTEVDYQIIEARIIELVNELRTDQGLNTVQSNDMLKAAATIRAQETEESFSHTRPNGSDAFTVLNEEGIEYTYRMVGENLAMGTYYMDDIQMAELFFDGWVESEGHYETMIQPDYQEIGIGVHYDGEFLYATQLFGTQMN